MNKDAIALIDDLNSVGSSLAQWAEVRLDDGSTVEEVRAELVEAMLIAEPQRVLARMFADFVKRDLKDHFEEIRFRNVGYDEGTCATHDFCDANEIMAEAFEEIHGRPPEIGEDTPNAVADVELWNAAWNIARTLFLTATAEELAERNALGERYVAAIGYNPFEDDGSITVAEVKTILAEHAEIEARGGLDA